MLRLLFCLSLLLTAQPAAADMIAVARPANPAQGQPFLVQIRPELPAILAEGQIFGETIVLEPLGDLLLGLAGVPRNQKPGEYSFKLTLKLADGGVTSVDCNVTVSKKDFQVSRLSVDPKYVDLDEKALKWIREDNAAAGKAYASSANSRLWHGPFVKPAEGRWSSPFGVRRMFNGQERSYHSGADIAIPTGTPVKAANDGRVVLVKSMFFGGNTVLLDHGLGVFTGYMHLSEFKVSQGDLVERGQVIGLSGATGRVTGAHLHWMLRIGSEKLDAAGLLELELE